MPGADEALQILGGQSPAPLGGQQESLSADAVTIAPGVSGNINANASTSSNDSATNILTYNKFTSTPGQGDFSSGRGQRALAILSGEEMPDDGAGTSSVSMSEASKEASPRDLGAFRTGISHASDAITFGLMKPAISALNASLIDPVVAQFSDNPAEYGGSFSERYHRHMDAQQQMQQEQDALHPIAAGVGDAAGVLASFAPATLAFKGLATMPQAASKLESLMQWGAKQALPNVATGATIGGLNAAGYAEPGQHTEALGEGAAVGAGLGLFVPEAAKRLPGVLNSRALSSALGAGAGALIADNPLLGAAGGAAAGYSAARAAPQLISRLTMSAEEQANAKILKKALDDLQAEGLTLQEAQQKLQQMGPDAMVADVFGENVRGLGRGVAGVAGEGKQIATKALDTRQAAQHQRVEDAMLKGMGSNTNYYDAETALIAQQKQSSALYNEAFKENRVVDVPVINRLLRTEAGKEALNIARKTMSDNQKRMSALDPELTEQAALTGQKIKGGVGKGLTMETLDNVKKSLDHMYSTMVRSDNAAVRARAAGVLDLKKALVNAMDEADTTAVRDKAGKIVQPGKYKQARMAFAEPAQQKEALEMGRAFITEDAELAARQLADMSPAEQELFRIGAARALRDKIRSTPYSADASKNIFGNPEQLFGSAAKRDRLKAVFPDQAAFDAFEQSMINEARMYQTREGVLRGSRTAPMLKDIEDALEVGDSVMNAAAGNYGSAARAFLGEWYQRLTALPPETRKLIAQKLFTNDPQKNAETMQALNQLLQPDAGRVSKMFNAVKTPVSSAYQQAIGAPGIVSGQTARIATQPTSP